MIDKTAPKIEFGVNSFWSGGNHVSDITLWPTNGQVCYDSDSGISNHYKRTWCVTESSPNLTNTNSGEIMFGQPLTNQY